jgi:hypothetical protein
VGGGGGEQKKKCPTTFFTILCLEVVPCNAIAIYIVDYYYYYSSYKGESAIIDWDNKHCYMPK